MFDFFIQHYPFIAVMAVLWLIGHFMSRSVFTRKRALETKYESRFWAGFWYWMRESMELHPVLTGALIGLLWDNPENYPAGKWGWQLNIAYFAGAGIASLFGWLVITKVLARFGIDTKTLTLPGESIRPPAAPATIGEMPKAEAVNTVEEYNRLLLQESKGFTEGLAEELEPEDSDA